MLSDASPHPIAVADEERNYEVPVVTKRKRWVPKRSPTPFVLLARYGWPVVLILFVMYRVGRHGFNPSDEGFVVANSWRILHGEVPHADIISLKPMGSAFLHIVDFAVPLPLVEASRLVAVVEVVLYSVLLARFAFARPVRQWNVFHVLGVAGSIFVNLHIFPLMAAVTVDGILLLAIGLNLLDTGFSREKRTWSWVGMACIGATALVKQSFAPALGIAGVWALWRYRRLTPGPRIRALASAASAALAPIIAYVTVVGLGGGWSEMIRQFRLVGDMPPAYGQHLVHIFDTASGRSVLVQVVVGVAAGLLLPLVARRLASQRRPVEGLWSWSEPVEYVGIGVVLVTTAVLVNVPHRDRYFSLAWWGTALLWGLLAVVVMRGALRRIVDWRSLVICLVGWMAMLSFGYPRPNLVAGTLLLVVIDRLWTELRISEQLLRTFRSSLFVAAVAALVLTVDGVVAARLATPYFDTPSSRLTFPLAAAGSAFGDVRTNPVTGSYVLDVSECIRRHPAHRVAVLPGYPGVYPYLRTRNPFPLDWMNPGEAYGSDARILEAAEELDRAGDYLVLFSPFPPMELARLSAPLPPGTVTDGSFLFDPLGSRIAERLSGERITCGSFVAFYKPA